MLSGPFRGGQAVARPALPALHSITTGGQPVRKGCELDKQTTLKKIQDGYNELLAAVKGLDEQQMSERFYGDWNIKDLLAHIAGWQRTMTEAMQRMARGEKPTPEGVDYSDADAWNTKFVAAMKPQSGPTMIAELQQSFANYFRTASALPEDRFGEGKTINRLLEASGYGHYEEHLPAIKTYRERVAGGA